MRIDLEIINPKRCDSDTSDSDIRKHDICGWSCRRKSYESDMVLDDDMKKCTVGHILDRVHLNDFQLCTKKDVDDLIEFLKNCKVSFTK